MSLQKLILGFSLWLVDVLTFFVKQDPNRITFVSLTQDHLMSDFFLIDEYLKKESFDVHYNLIVFEKNWMGDLKYFFNCLKQLIDLKKSRLVIINDNNFVISHRKPKKTKVLQVWHACGAIKKFGNEIHRQYPIRNYDAILANAKAWQPIYASSFGVREDQVYVTGMPRLDTLLDWKQQEAKIKEFYCKYPQCKNKKLYLYAPTFRGNIIDGFQIQSIDFKKLEDELTDCIFLCKFHPLLKEAHVDSTIVVNVNEEDLYTLFGVSDCLISDYSSIFLDYSLLNKPMIAYVDDLESYEQTIGLNVDLRREFPGPVCFDEEQLVESLKHLTIDPRLKTFQEKYVVYTDGKNTERVVSLIRELME